MVKYNALLLLSWLIIIPVSIIRLFSGKDTVNTLRARFAFRLGRAPDKPILWCHAASVGELNTLQTLIPSLQETNESNEILITTSNIVAFANAMSWDNPHLHVAVAPLDYKSVVNRFLKHWSPIALITIENEIFPNRTVMSQRAGAKIIWINARMSTKSFKFWQKHRSLTDQVIDCIDYVFAQDATALKRFEALGVTDRKLTQTQNLKKFYYAAPVVHPDLQLIRKAFDYESTICAASTHPKEDEILLDAFKIALQQTPTLKLIIVPRHTNRSAAIEEHIKQRNLQFATRSKGELPQPSDQVYLADTFGELPIWYSASATTFVAGSLRPIGGHTPFEPTAYGSVIIHGNHFSNFQDIYTGLQQSEGAIMASNPSDIAKAWLKLRIPENRQQYLENAQQHLLDAENMDQAISVIIQKTVEVITQSP